MAANDAFEQTAGWPALPYPQWQDTCAALHLWTQIVGKIRLAQSPWVNHGWHCTLYVTPRGLATSSIPHGTRAFQIDFDFIEHLLVIEDDTGRFNHVPLQPMSTAQFHEAVLDALAAIGLPVHIHGRPNEMPGAVPFAQDDQERPYDRDAVRRFHHALIQIDRVFNRFRSGFIGKASPVHLFWGSFDLAVSRFSGRLAPPHPGGIPGLPDAITREAYSHEVSSAGFWPGGGAIDYPAFYAYAYPAPPGFERAAVEPAAAFFEPALGEFLLPYEAVAASPDAEAVLLAFLQSTYAAAADGAGWDRAHLECPLGEPRVPRILPAA